MNGNTKRVLFSLSLPLIFSNIISTLYVMADGAWVARLSTTQFAATSFTWPLLFLFVSIAIGVSVAGTSIISQMVGAGKREEASKYANNLIIISLILGVSFSLLGFFTSEFIIGVMGAKGDLYEYSVIYFKVNSICFLIDSIYFAIQAILNAQGKTKSTTMMGLISGLLNIVLDPIFIFKEIPFVGLPGLNLGIAGAAIATALAKLIAVVIGFIAVKRDTSEVEISLSRMKADKHYIKKLFNMAVPMAIGQSGAALGFTVMNSILVVYGKDLVAGFSMVNRITEFWLQIAMGMSAAMTAMIGQNMGAKKFDRARQIVRDATMMNLISSAIGILIVGLFSRQLLSIFLDPAKDINVYSIAMDYLPYAIVNMPFIGLFTVYQGTFQGVGQMKYSMHMSNGRLWVIRVPFVLICQKFTSMGQLAIWIGMVISNVFIVIYSYYIYKSKDIIPNECHS